MSAGFDPMTIAARQPSQTVLYDEEGAMARTLDALAEVAEAQAGASPCVLCGQRVNIPDLWGLCSKVTDDHREYRAAPTMTTARKARSS